MMSVHFLSTCCHCMFSVHVVTACYQQCVLFVLYMSIHVGINGKSGVVPKSEGYIAAK